MWHWLRKSVLAIDPLIRFCIILSGGLHLFLIVATMVSYWLKPAHQISIFKNTLTTKEVTIIIDPHAPITGVIMQKGMQKTTRGLQENNNSAIKNENKKPATTMVAEKKKSSSPAKKQQKTAPKKTVAKPKKQQPKPAKPKKIMPKKQHNVETKKESKKTEVSKSKEISEKKDTTQKVETPVTQAPHQESAPVVPEGIIIPDGIEGPIMIARSAADAAGLVIQREIQEALLAVWRPPVGVEEGVSCTIRVQLQSDGIVQSLEIVRQSGMMLFDVSARAALQKTVWPRAVWGTTLELCLQ